MTVLRTVLTYLYLVLPVAFWPGSTSFDAPKFAVAGVAVGVCCIILAATKTSIPGPNRGLLGVGGIVLGVILLSLVRALQPLLVLRTAWLFLLWFLIAFFTSLTSDGPAFRRYLRAAVAGVALCCIYGWLQMVGWLPGAPPISGYPPGISTLGNQNYLAGLAAAAFWPSVLLWSEGRRWLGLAGTAVPGITLLAAGATGPLVAVMGSGLFLAAAFLLCRRRKPARVPALLGLSILAAFLAAGLLTTAVLLSSDDDALARRLVAGNNGHVRRTDWYVALAMFRSSPGTGIGAGNFGVGWIDTRAGLDRDDPALGLAPYARITTRAHQEILQAAAETGLVGLAALVGLTVVLGRFWRRRWQRLTAEEDRREFLFLTGGIMTVGLHCLVSFPLHLPATGLMVALMVGRMAAPSSRPVALTGIKRGFLLGAGSVLILFSGWLFGIDLTLARGNRFFVVGNMEKARSTLSRAVSLTPWPGQGLLTIGLAELATQRPDDAAVHLQASLRHEPSFEAMLSLAETWIDRGQFGRADSLLTTAQCGHPLFPTLLQVRYLQGLLAMRRGDRLLARDTMAGVLAEDPTNYRAMLALGYLSLLAGARDEAGDFYRNAERTILSRKRELEKSPYPEAVGERYRLDRNLEVARRAIASLDQR